MAVNNHHALVDALVENVALMEIHRKTGRPPFNKMIIQLEKSKALLKAVQP